MGAGGLASSVAGSIISRLAISTKLSTSSISAPPTRYVSAQASLFLQISSSYALSIASTELLHLPAHPAGLCLEALLSLMLKESVIEKMINTARGAQMFQVFVTNLLETICPLLENALDVAVNVDEFDFTARSSHLVTNLEGILSGAEIDVESGVNGIHDMIMNTNNINASEVLVLAFQLMQVVIRLLLKCAFSATRSTLLTREYQYFFPSNMLSYMSFYNDMNTVSMHKIMVSIFDRVVENFKSTCSAFMNHSRDSSVVRRTIGMLAETTLAAGVLGLNHTTALLVSRICQYSVPLPLLSHNENSVYSDVHMFRWKHVQAVIRLLQISHVLADSFVDWDHVVDSFEKISTIILPIKGIVHEDVTPLDIDRINLALDRFKNFTIYLSDSSLVKLMTSMVALSMQRFSSGTFLGQLSGEIVCESARFSIDANDASNISFLLTSIVDIVKLNSFRVAVVWQMVSSHLKLVCSLKVSVSMYFTYRLYLTFKYLI